MKPDSIPIPLKFACYYPLVKWQDRQANRRLATADKRFLVTRCPGKDHDFYDVLLDWLEENFPQLRAHFELHALPYHVRDWSPYVLHLPWLQDPVQHWSPLMYRLSSQLDAQCDARHIPIINRVNSLTNAAKSTGAALIASTGIKTARMKLITDIKAFRETRLGLKLPLFVRSDWGHGGQIFRADTDAELQALPIEKIDRPVAIEVVDVSDAQGFYRKYRYVMAGEVGIAQSIHIAKTWLVRGRGTSYSEALRDEEIAYINAPDPNHARLLAACKALGFDFVAFDYSYDKNGELVVWEANPYPRLHLGGSERRQYRHAPTKRIFAAMTKLYLERAGLPVPSALLEKMTVL